MTEIEFKPWPKIARLNRDIVITEKIDGTNAAVVVLEDGTVGAQSRNRVITPENDNHGFARWVADNENDLLTTLGVGYHYGEWWGSGIQRGYGLVKGEKRFSLFNTGRWENEPVQDVPGLDVVPVLYKGPFDQGRIDEELATLRYAGSRAADFGDPEGIVIWHEAARKLFKVTLVDDEKPKGN